MLYYKGFKIRIYPTKEQVDVIWKHVHASRFIWNYMLSTQEEIYKNGGKFLNAYGMNYLLKPLREMEEYSWLKEISYKTLQRTCSDLATAYIRFFDGKGHPKYKSRKKAKPSFPVRCEETYFKNGLLHVEKIGKIKYKTDYIFPNGRLHCFKDVRLAYNMGKYYISFVMECENQAPSLTDNSMGIDLGIKELAVVAYGDKRYVFHNINKSKKIREIHRRIKYTKRNISRKYEAGKQGEHKYIKTSNIIREEEKLRRLYERETNIKLNYMHQITHLLVSMLPHRVVMEDLNIAGLIKNRHLSNAFQNQALYKFINQMRYKCEWNGIEFVQADRFFPSSKTCSCCGFIKKDLKLIDRTFICPECGLVIDRDYNAAINLSKYTV